MFNRFFKKKLPESFCIAPFLQIDLHEQGHVNACCKAKDILGYWSKSKISEIWNDQPIQKLREQFLNGERPKGCRSCWDMESKGKPSRRIEYNSKSLEQMKAIETEFNKKKTNALVRPLKLTNLDIGFGAQCNLKCRMCGPSASSSWLGAALKNKEVYKYYVEMGELSPSVQEVNYKDFLNENLFIDFCQNIAPNVEDLMISGGEPLMSKHHFRLFSEMIPEEKLGKMKVSLTTNAQTTQFQGKSLLPYWKKLKYFVYRISFDNVGERFGYIRSGGDLEKIQISLNEVRSHFPLQEGRLKIVFTVALSLYNIEDIPAITRFVIRNGAFLHINWVNFPQFLSVDGLPTAKALEVAEQLRDFKTRLSKLLEWGESPLWAVPLRVDLEYPKHANFLRENGIDPEAASYRDRAQLRIEQLLTEIISSLEKPHRPKRLSGDFKKHIVLMDQLNQTDFSKVYPSLHSYL